MFRWSDACWLPYIVYGDVGQCHLPRNHRGTCFEANEVHIALTRTLMDERDRYFTDWLNGSDLECP